MQQEPGLWAERSRTLHGAQLSAHHAGCGACYHAAQPCNRAVHIDRSSCQGSIEKAPKGGANPGWSVWGPERRIVSC